MLRLQRGLTIKTPPSTNTPHSIQPATTFTSNMRDKKTITGKKLVPMTIEARCQILHCRDRTKQCVSHSY